jgi:site-specific DNA recombinase
MTGKPLIRCAIYTRKSSEEGLDQAFNSLHAQREACEAYVMSQAGEGWIALPAPYDDGGFSGGNIERPALKRLLADIGAGKVDTVVVYKIDRLTRALNDFAKIVDRLDAAGASFVSVTQAFNTTTSMGRLTLNVLLSFAQFEREVTGERIRDKLAASKAKGMWMGGVVPLGYDRPTDLVTRALVVNEAEAQTVRLIYSRYLELGSVSRLQRWLANDGYRSKTSVSRRGRSSGGLPYSRGALFHLLKNRLYLGEIPHKGLVHPGAHAAIVERDLFDMVQVKLASQAAERKSRPTRVGAALLKGVIFDADGFPMCPAFARGRGDHPYRYYVSAPLTQGRQLPEDPSALRRISANAVEAVVADRLRRVARLGAASSSAEIRRLVRRVEIHPRLMQIVVDAEAIGSGQAIEVIVDRVDAHLAPGESVTPESGQERLLRLSFPIRMQTRGGRTWIATPDGRDAVPQVRIDRTLVRALRAAHGFAAEAGHRGDAGEEAAAPIRAYDRKLCLLAFLAPDIQQAILEGRQPASLNLERLMKQDLPLAWAHQRPLLGF